MGEYKVREVLRENVLELMNARYQEENLNRLARDTGIGVATAKRLKDAKTYIGLKNVEAIAKFFKVEPFELLMPPKVLKLYRTVKNKDFLVLCQAYNESDKTGKEFLLLNAETLLEKARRDGGRSETG